MHMYPLGCKEFSSENMLKYQKSLNNQKSRAHVNLCYSSFQVTAAAGGLPGAGLPGYPGLPGLSPMLPPPGAGLPGAPPPPGLPGASSLGSAGHLGAFQPKNVPGWLMTLQNHANFQHRN